LILGFYRAFLKSVTFYWPTNALNCIQLAHTPQVQKITLPNTDYAHKNITCNFGRARSTLLEDGSQRIRNMSEFLIVFSNIDTT